MNSCNEKDIRTLLDCHGFRFSKGMGQNFLIEGWVPKDIVGTSDAGPDIDMLEIGPGIGPLTMQLARRAARVAAIELNRTLYPILTGTLTPYPNTEVAPGDAMKLDLAVLTSDRFPGLTAVAYAGLPYNITTPVPTALIRAGCFVSVTMMIQWGVTLRICAAPSSSDYGMFSVFCQYHTQPELLFEVGPECFLPAPKVTSAAIQLVPRSVPPQNLVGDSFFFQVVRAPFAQRRRTLPNGLSSAFGSRLSKDTLCGAIEAAELPADIRGERLGIPEFATLASTLQSHL